MDIDEFNDEESLQIAQILKEKAEYKALSEGRDNGEAENEGIKAFNKARRKHVIEFLKRIEDRLQELSNPEIAKLLQALIAMGLSIEDEEELEYWISFLEMQSLQRLASYFALRNGIDENGNLKRSPKFREKVLSNTARFSSKDTEAFASIVVSLQKIHQKKMPKNKEGKEYKKLLEREKFFKKIEQIIKKDTQEKKKEEAQRQKQAQKVVQKPNNKEDAMGILTGKMLSAGVESGSEYWNSVISNYDASMDKGDFARNWVKDGSQDIKSPQKIQELRGIQKENKDNAGKSGEESQSQQNQQNQQNSNNRNSGKSNSGNSQGAQGGHSGGR